MKLDFGVSVQSLDEDAQAIVEEDEDATVLYYDFDAGVLVLFYWRCDVWKTSHVRFYKKFDESNYLPRFGYHRKVCSRWVHVKSAELFESIKEAIGVYLPKEEADAVLASILLVAAP